MDEEEHHEQYWLRDSSDPEQTVLGPLSSSQMEKFLKSGVDLSSWYVQEDVDGEKTGWQKLLGSEI